MCVSKHSRPRSPAWMAHGAFGIKDCLQTELVGLTTCAEKLSLFLRWSQGYFFLFPALHICICEVKYTHARICWELFHGHPLPAWGPKSLLLFYSMAYDLCGGQKTIMNHPQLCPALRSRQAFFGQWSKQVEVFSALISRVFRELTPDPLVFQVTTRTAWSGPGIPHSVHRTYYLSPSLCRSTTVWPRLSATNSPREALRRVSFHELIYCFNLPLCHCCVKQKQVQLNVND